MRPSLLRISFEVAAHCCSDARHALDTSLAAYERALPPPHFNIDLTDHKMRRGLSATVEPGLFDGKAPMRVINRFGITAEHVIEKLARATSIQSSSNRDIFTTAIEKLGSRKALNCPICIP